MNDTSVEISIIIPTYNRGLVISQAIQSVKDQTDHRWDLIVVDDGSTDGTEEIIKPFLEDQRIKYYYQENSGVSSARNLGANLAKGKYLIFLDSDDAFYTNLISELYKHDFFQYDLIFWQVTKNIDNKSFLWKPVNLGKLYHNIKASFLAGSVCYRKEIFMKAGGYDKQMKFGENYELGLRISALDNLEINYIKQAFLLYTINTKNRTSNSYSNKLDSHIYQYSKHREKYIRDPKANSTMNYLIGYVYEKTGDKISALKYYQKSWEIRRFNFKSLLKTLYLTIAH